MNIFNRFNALTAFLGILAISIACGPESQRAQRGPAADASKSGELKKNTAQSAISANDQREEPLDHTSVVINETNGTTATDGSSKSDSSTQNRSIPDNIQLRSHVVNIVSAEASDDVVAYLNQDTPKCPPEMKICRRGQVAANVFFNYFPDEYDFVYMFTDATGPFRTAGVSQAIFRPAIPTIGITAATELKEFGSKGRLKNLVVLNLSAGNGPTLHETLHYWATYLDTSLGFSRVGDGFIGGHWGMTGFKGQLGGFDPASVECEVPAGGKMPCKAGSDGKIYFRVNSFGANANGGDSLPYSPLELYLMGLLPAKDVPSPIYTLQGAKILESGQKLRLEASSISSVTMQNIIAIHGEQKPAASKPTFKAAFVVFTKTKASQKVMDAAQRWASIFGGDTQSGLLSFERATQGLAKMDAKIGPLK